METVFCLAEDRHGAEIGLRFEILSVRDHCPGAKVYLYRPDATPEFREWLRGFPFVEHLPHAPPGASSWNCKPQALLPLLERHESVIWLDSDILLAGDPRPLFAGLAADELVLVEEQKSSKNQGTAVRTRGWGLPVGREWPITLNTCVLRVTRAHRPLLHRWRELLERPEYAAWQGQVLSSRPLHGMSDQDVLNAVLGSAEFADARIRLLRAGRDVIHAGGALAYSLGERLGGLLRPIPPILHGQGIKPWVILNRSPEFQGWFWFYRRLMQEVSPYVAETRKYRAEVGEDCGWMDWKTPLGVLGRLAGFGHHALRGLPLTAVATVMDALGRGR